MKKLITAFCLSFLILVSSPVFSFGCMLSPNPVKKFKANEYIFIGEVIGYTKLYEKKPAEVSDNETKSRNSKSELKPVYKQWISEPTKAIGLIVKIDTAIFTPKLPVKFYEVIPFELQASCNYQGKYSIELNISKDFPIGAKIRVIGSESTIFPNPQNPDNVKIEVTNFDLVRNDNPTDEPVTTPEVKLNYKKLKYGEKHNLRAFELRKDTKRLEFSNSSEEVIRILERLAYYPVAWEIDYEMLVRNYVHQSDKEQIEKLLRMRRDYIEKPEN